MLTLLRIRSLVVSAALVSACPAQETPKITVLGASLSKGMALGKEAARMGGAALVAGFPEHRKSSIGLGELVAKVAKAKVTDHSDLYLFSQPRVRAAQQVQAAVAEQPELVIAIDLVFWFGYWPDTQALGKADSGNELLQGYGKVDAEIEKAIRSLEKQEAGFALVDELLAKTKATIVLADYPDMFGANPMMLSPRHIPLRRTLDELDRRLHEFVAKRPRVVLFGLADYVKRAKLGKVELPGGGGRMVTSESAIQADNLHPTRLGTALVLHELLGMLATKLGDRASALLGPRPEFQALVEAAGAQKDLAIALEAPPAPESRPAGK